MRKRNIIVINWSVLRATVMMPTNIVNADDDDDDNYCYDYYDAFSIITLG